MTATAAEAVSGRAGSGSSSVIAVRRCVGIEGVARGNRVVTAASTTVLE